MENFLDESVGFNIYRANLKLRSNLFRAFKAFDITPEQWAILNRLWEKDGVTQKQLSDQSLKDQPNVTRILDKLEQRGLLKRESSPSDRRVFLVFLTDAGHNIKEKLFPVAVEVRERMLSGLSAEEIKKLNESLKKIINYPDQK